MIGPLGTGVSEWWPDMSELSPFTSKRYEHAGSHVYFIPPDAIRQLETAIPTYLVGTRGTGKTTLLKALSWDERLYNASLRNQLGDDAFDQRYVGLYFKLPNIQLDLIDRWLRSEEDSDYAPILSFYLDLCWLELAQLSLLHLTARDVIEIEREAEEQFLSDFRQIWNQYPRCQEIFGECGNSITEVLALMHPMRRGLERFAQHRTSVVEVLDALPVGQIGSFGRTVGTLLAQSLTSPDDQDVGANWSFRICMDEGEVLGLRQQRVINSMVRLTEWPVFYLVAYVSRPTDATGTFLPNQTLQLADRQILVRDDMKDAEFKSLAEGIVNVRIRSQGKARTLNVNQILGRLNINSLLEIIINRSEDSELRLLLDEARSQREAPDRVPPIYETYLRLKRPEYSLENPSSPFARRQFSSRSIRKQMVGAYLSICRDAGAHPMYASADMLFQMSDKCVRDFLWQMESVFQASALSLDEFLEAKIDEELQNRGLRTASQMKMTLFRERVISSPTEANQFVEGLARITALIQSTGRNYEQLRTPERGIFSYNLSKSIDPRITSEHTRLIRDASETGLLRLVDDSDPEELRFRVHASLAPEYDFSYRGAYYPAGELSDRDIQSLRLATTSQRMTNAIGVIVTRITGRRTRRSSRDQLILLDLESESDDET